MANIYDLVDTWNNGGTTFTAIKMNVTDTASNAASLLFDLQVGGASKFKVDKTGKATFAQGTSNAPSIMVDGGGGNSGFGSANGYDYYYTRAGSPIVYFGFNRLDLGTGLLTFASAVSGTADLGLTRNAAGIAEINNGTAGTFRDLRVRHVRPEPTAAGSLISAATAGQGSLAWVTDATATTPRSTVAGGGANKVLVASDGTNWIIIA